MSPREPNRGPASSPCQAPPGHWGEDEAGTEAGAAEVKPCCPADLSSN